MVDEELPLSQGVVDGGGIGSGKAMAVAAASKVMQACTCAGAGSDWKGAGRSRQTRQASVLGESCGRAECSESGTQACSWVCREVFSAYRSPPDSACFPTAVRPLFIYLHPFWWEPQGVSSLIPSSLSILLPYCWHAYILNCMMLYLMRYPFQHYPIGKYVRRYVACI